MACNESKLFAYDVGSSMTLSLPPRFYIFRTCLKNGKCNEIDLDNVLANYTYVFHISQNQLRALYHKAQCESCTDLSTYLLELDVRSG